LQYSVPYKLAFAVGLCAVCALLVSTVSVSLRDRQQANRRMLGQGRQILSVAGLIAADEQLSREDIAERLFTGLDARLVDLESGRFVAEGDAVTYDQEAAAEDPATSRDVAENPAGVKRVPKLARIFVRSRAGKIESVILPIEGQGLWGEMRGFLAVAGDGRTIRGITFYEHSETPGYGAEVDSPAWKALWNGRLAYDENGVPRIAVKKGQAGSPEQDPYQVDGISGSTLTGDAVTHLVRFWLGDHGFGPFLRRLRERETT
jgi:Na+-transporting NADH:ubiquinone oxidoreductase subunit C